MRFEGTTHCNGDKICSSCVIVRDERLNKYKGKKLRYKLELTPDSYYKKKIEKNKVTLIGKNQKSLLFEVESYESGKTHLVDVSFGCGCEFGSKKGISNKLFCSHILSVLNKIGR